MLNKKFPLKFKVTLGTKELTFKEFQSLNIEKPIVLNKLVNDFVDICLDNYIVAKGEIVIIDGYFGVQICEICDIEISQKKSILMEFVFGDFYLNYDEFFNNEDLKGTTIKLYNDKDLFNRLDYILINGESSNLFNVDISSNFTENGNYCINLQSTIDINTFKKHNLKYYENALNDISIDNFKEKLNQSYSKIFYLFNNESILTKYHLFKYLNDTNKFMIVNEFKNIEKEISLYENTTILIEEIDLVKILNKLISN